MRLRSRQTQPLSFANWRKVRTVLLIVGLVAVGILALFYVVGRNAIARDRADQSSMPSLPGARPSVREFGSSNAQEKPRQHNVLAGNLEDTIYLTNAFDSYYTSDGLDTFLSTARTREWNLEEVYSALQKIGAGQIVPTLRQADEEYDRYARESDNGVAELGSTQHQTKILAYQSNMRTFEATIDGFNLNLEKLASEFARQPDARR